MADCLDANILKKLVEQFETMIDNAQYANTPVKAVELLRAKLKFHSFPMVMIIPMPLIPDEENQGIIENAYWRFLIWYFDGQEEPEGELSGYEYSYLWRYRNTRDDLRRCLDANFTLNGTCQNIVIQDADCSLFIDELAGVMQEGYYMAIEIQRIQN